MQKNCMTFHYLLHREMEIPSRFYGWVEIITGSMNRPSRLDFEQAGG